MQSVKLARDTLAAKKRYDRWAGVFDFLEQLFEKIAFSQWRRKMLAHARGNVCEMGIGTGRNVPFYPANCSVTGFDISPGMLHLLRSRYRKLNGAFSLSLMDAQHIAIKDNYFDTVLATFIFCTIPEPVLALKEARRVCKPGGRLLLMEHVRVNSSVAGPIMDFLNPLARFLFRDNINRNTEENVRKAGWDLLAVKSYSGGMVNFIIAQKGDISNAW